MGKLRKPCTAYPPRKVYVAAVMKLSTEHDYHAVHAQTLERVRTFFIHALGDNARE
jgi:hypothetical protein